MQIRVTAAISLACLLAVPTCVLSLSAHAAEGTVTIAMASDVPTMDPTIDTSPIGQNVRLNIFDQLTQINPDGTVSPRLAESWTTSEDGKTWTFKLRTGAKWHDGTQVTIDDVIWTYDKIRGDKQSSVRPYLSKIGSMERLSDTELRIVLVEAFAPFDRQVALVSIASKAAYESLGADVYAQKPIGSGPYRLIEWTKDDRIVMEAFDDYWDGEPSVETMILRPIPADASRATALASGEVDIVPLLAPQLAETLANREGITIKPVQSHKVVYVGFDMRNGILGNPDFRRAIDKSIDRSAITTQLLRGLGEPSGQIVAPVTFGYDPAIRPTEYDPEGARELLAKSGYDGTPLVMQYPNNNVASNDAVAQAVAGYMTEIGIKVDLQGMEYTAFFPLWVNRQLNGMNMFSYGPTNLDADLPLTSLYETGRTRGYWENEETDVMIRAQRAEPDPAKRQALITKIWEQTKAEVIYSTLYNETHVWGHNARVTVTPRPDGIVRLSEIELVSE